MATSLDKSETETNRQSSFSYAQAAKGLSGPEKAKTSSTKPSSRSQSPIKVDGPNSGVTPPSEPEAKFDGGVNGSAEKSLSPVASIETRSRRDHTAEKATNSGRGSQSRPTSSSPEYVISSTSTLVKEDDNLSLPNAGSSESTWENKSQVSIQVDKLNENHEAEGAKSQDQDQSKASSSSKSLQEAPVPVVNYWKQRANEAKVKRDVPKTIGKAHAGMVAQGVTPQSSGNGTETNSFRNKAGSYPNVLADNRPFPNNTKDRKKSLDTSMTDKDTPNLTQRHNSFYAPDEKFDSHNRHKSRLTSIGPTDKTEGENGSRSSLIDDHETWPTPENAHDDERKKSQSKGEKGEKERVGSTSTRPHGKNEWVPVPINPSVIFNTPLPRLNSRRGRGVARGGRDVGPRAGTQHTHQQVLGEGESVQAAEVASADRTKRGRHDTITTTSDKTSPRQRIASTLDDASVRPEILSPSAGGSSKGTTYTDKNDQPQRHRSPPQRNQAPSQSMYARHSYSGRGKVGRRFEGHGNYDRRRGSETGYSRFDNVSTYAKPTTEQSMNSDGNWHKSLNMLVIFLKLTVLICRLTIRKIWAPR